MKKQLTLALAFTALGLAACPEKTLGGHVDDALDNRPAEKVQDKMEDVSDAVKDATN